MLRDRHQYLAAEMAAFLFGGELVLEMHACGTRFDHRLHQLVGVERAAETGLRIGDDRRHPISAVAIALEVGDLVGAAQRVVDPRHHARNRVHRIKRLVRIHLARDVGIGRDLPAGEIDCLEPALDLLTRLIAGQRPKGRQKRLGREQLPQPCGAQFCQRVPDAKRTGQAFDIRGPIGTPEIFYLVTGHVPPPVKKSTRSITTFLLFYRA